ncbi:MULTISPECIES: MoxR family ATPase [unclassified Lacihabitans]|jgi:MoxR-like ATPase|uniref:AAA family ATPase n=1 Tax=unclassified Lacihabitans TaxID=2638817 RepID=UPI000BD6EB04|nr:MULTISPECIES: MoxR family ATPase [unclassified Lacihabitans]MBP6620335.1 MoxR family ATPase [Leadbetterella sp.]OYU65246.1 MAG: ATPase [Cytophagaceae bacterium BCCC1]MCP9748501.1 MoxR family ATPase [Lacihabitans sp. CS3-21]MCP9754745.1 MoxR family ATPase [Lacihabitans sp. CCS-44]MDP1813007.1 MoxR family ATPase [Leadbetterella sp.]
MNKIDSLYKKIDDVLAEVHKVVIGQEYLINRLLIGLFTDGHILLEGVPGLAKTKTVNTLAKVLDLGFRRVQFTPDLLPSDLVGTMIYNQKSGDFEVKKGPIFANLILADEVNRAPAKVQSALLEAMAEKQITIGEESFQLDPPFLVMATQNPVEQEGTYPLPEAQVDRFMMKVYVDYLDKKSELEMIRKIANMDFKENVKSVLGKNDILEIKKIINGITISDMLERYIVELVFATRNPEDYGLKEEARYIQYGVSPRAGIAIHKAAKALAFFDKRDYVLPEDIKAVVSDVFNHRIILNYEAEADGINTRQIVEAILKKVAIGG